MDYDKPIIRYIETTGRCNMHCAVCVDRIRNFDMSVYDFQQVIDKNKSLLDGQALWLDFNGEPLMDAHIFDRIQALHRCGANPRISTNGFLLSKDTAKRLATVHPAMVSVSIMTLDRDQYEKYHAADCFDVVLNNLLNCKEVFDKEDAKIHVQAVKLDVGNAEENNAFIHFFHSYGIDVACHRFTNRAKTVHLDLSQKELAFPRGICIDRKQNIAVLADCQVVLCCCDYAGKGSIGNLRDFDYSVENLLAHSLPYKKFLENQKNKVFSGVCENCSDWICFQQNAKEEYVSLYFH